MIRLDTHLKKLQAILGGAVTTNQPTAIVCYTDKENENQKKFFIESFISTLNNTTAVDICQAPDKAMVREIDSIHIRNNDTVAATVTVRINDDGANYEVIEVSLLAGETLVYTKTSGWSTISVYGHQTAVFNYIDFVSGTFPDAAQRLKWSDTDGTLEIGLKGGNVNLSVGLEEAVIAKEASNGGIEIGKAYYFVGSDGSNKTVAKARANVMAQAELCLGIAAESSTGGNKAFICTFGLVRNINTNHLTEGAPVYLSAATAGELTATIPASPNYVVFVGYCIKQSATVGAVFVSINSGTHLEYLHDVKLTSVATNNILKYNGVSSRWENMATGTGVLDALSISPGTTGSFVVNGGALGTPSSGTVTNLTGTASININGTVGATTPTTGAFTTVSASGVATFSAGTAAAPAITTSGDTNNGIFFPAADVTAITTAGSERMRVDNSGNVGIGTSSPGNKLEVNGNVGLLANGQLKFADAGNIYVSIIKNSGASSTSQMEFLTGTTPTERMRIDSSGNVGIGTTTPQSRLDVSLSATASPVGVPTNVVANFIRDDTATVNLIGYTAGISAQLIAYAANGTGASPTAITAEKNILRILGLGYNGSAFTGSRAEIAFISSQAWTTTNNGTYIKFDTTADNSTVKTERMRINSAGELLIGTTTDNGAYLLQVNSQIYATNATIATSDARLKENVAPITNALEAIGKVQAVAFDFKQGTEYNFDTVRQTGFIAQDLQVALADEDYKDSIVKECGPYLGVAYEKMVPVLVAAIQEQQQQIDSLKAEVTALKGN